MGSTVRMSLQARACVAGLAGVLLLSALPSSSTQAGAVRTEAKQAAALEPFKAHVPDDVLDDLRRRVDQARWPDQLPDTGWEYGADIRKVRELADYWRSRYDWRAFEARLNRFDQFTTDIDGQQVYFIHQRSPRPDATPLLLIHGWPGSIVEFLALVEPLTNPKDPTSPAFHVVVPSLPGFGFSGPTHSRGWGPERMAKALVTLMERLGYSRYGVQGGDWGSTIARCMPNLAPGRVLGLHLNLIFVPPPSPAALSQLSADERRRYRSWWDEGRSSFFPLQSREPQTVAYALTDSPVGWLAWTTMRFQDLVDHDGDFLHVIDKDTFLDDVTLYWVTGTVGSSLRIYRENQLAGQDAEPPRFDTPVAYADFPKEVATPPYRWIAERYNVVQRTEMPRGGHFAALEQPDLFLRDVRMFFAKISPKGTGPSH
jgi:pimeloyl-ACP methyl ester carboxylesterase